jgi:glutamate/aspartate transport system permease protein
VFTDFDFDVIQRALPYMGKGMLFTLGLTFLAMIGGIVIGTVLALMRLSASKILSIPASGYVNLLRSTPLILVIFWFYFLVPIAIKKITGDAYAEGLGPFHSALIAFTMFEAAYYCEIIRAGIQSVPRGQVHAGYAVGMSYAQTMRLIVLPQAFRNMLPVLLTQTIILFQDTSLVYAIGAYDMLKGFTTAGKIYGRPEEAYLLAAVVYFAICFGLSWTVKRLQAKIAIVR